MLASARLSNPSYPRRSQNVVEATRVELVSENLSVQLSTSVVYLLKFLKLTADKQAVSISSS